MDKLFHGDIEMVEIPDGRLELAPGLTLGCLPEGIRFIVCAPLTIWQDEQSNEWQSLRTLFLRQPSEDERE